MRRVTRVLMVVRPSEGGAFEHVRSLARAISERGHEVAICGPHGHHRELGVELIELDIVRRPNPVSDMRAVGELIRIIRRFRPDLVHAHGSKGGVMARLARLRAPGIPLVFTPHGFAFAGHFSRGWETRAFRAAEWALAPLASRVICVCEAEASLARTVGAGARVRVVHNGIEPPTVLGVDPSIRALAANGPLVGVLSGLRPGKGLETMIEALSMVRAAGSAAQLVVAGEGVERPRLERLAGDLGVADAVHLVGVSADPYAFLGALDVFALPSWAESFPYSVLEAMAAGLPIVATRVGGVPEAIQTDVSGLLVEARSVDQLAHSVNAILEDPATAAKLGTAARERRAASFSLAKMVAGTLGVYGEVATSA
jgi:glycosyltransferase involved in cell wall biosynthesis